MDRLLGAARDLSEKVESNESAAGELLRQCETLQEELKAMRQVRVCVFPVNDAEGSMQKSKVKIALCVLLRSRFGCEAL